MAIYTLTPAQLKGAGIYNSFVIPANGGSFTNTKSFYNELGGGILPATANSGDLSYLNNQGIISASVWFKILSQTSASYQFVTMVAGKITYFRFQLSYDTSGVSPRVNCFLTINSTQALIGNATLTLNNGWHHFMITYDTSLGGNFYINGNVLAGTSVLPASFTSTTDKPTFFGGTGQLTEYNATQLAIWNRVLTSQEINDVYNNGCPSDLTSLNPNTWLKMDDAFDNGLGITLPDNGSDNATIESVQQFPQGILTDSPCP